MQRELKNKIQTLARAYLPQVILMRRYLHAHAELSFNEVQTAAFICEELKKLGVAYKNGIAGTGVVAIIEGTEPDFKTVALRADMDALPIDEKNEVSYKSQTAGVMHACGHDVHTASLLGAARLLQELRNEFKGRVKLLFQPGEEVLPGGASMMIQEKVLENPAVTCIFGQHVQPSMEVGKVGFKPGMYMASTDELHLTIEGKGGHAALPSSYNNPLLMASEILLELEKEFSAYVTYPVPTVLAFGKITGMGATNVIPNLVKVEGTFRTMNEQWRQEAHTKMRAIAEGVAKKRNGNCQFTIVRGYPFLANDKELTERSRTYAIEYLGSENVETLDIRMTAEDFAYYSQEVPACFYRLGTGNSEKGIVSGVHTDRFDIDEAALETGMGLMTWIAMNELLN